MTFQFKLFASAPEPEAPMRKKRPVPISWRVADHACRFCFGRVLERVSKGNIVEVRCAECGQHSLGGPEEICCCGTDCGVLGWALECFKNPNISAEVPQQIMVREYIVKSD